MNERIIGIDLGLKHNHRASILDKTSNNFLGKSFSVDRSYEGFESLLKRCLNNAEQDTRLIFILEPTSMAWLPLSCYLLGKGHQVYLVNPQQVSALRKFFGLNKSDRLDSETLAKIYLVKPKSLHSIYLPQQTTSSISRFCKQRAKLVKQTSSIKRRLWHIFTFVNPKALEAFKEDKFSQLGRGFLRNLISPYKIVALGLDGLTAFLTEHCYRELAPEIPKKLFEASQSTVHIYQEYQDQHGLPFDLEQIQFEVNLELDILEYYEQKIEILDKKIMELYLKVDPQKQLHSITGIADVLAPILCAVVGDITRFPNVRSFKGFLRFHPKKKQTTNKDKKGLRIVKSSFWLLKQSFYMAAEVARHWDVELAAFYHRLINRGLHHDQAICAIANKLAGRVYAVMKRMADRDCDPDKIAYQFRDLNGNPIDKKKAKKIINEKYPGKYEQEKRQQQKKQQRQYKNKSHKQQPVSNDLRTTNPKFNSNYLDERLEKTQSMQELLNELIPQLFESEKLKHIEKS